MTNNNSTQMEYGYPATISITQQHITLLYPQYGKVFTVSRGQGDRREVKLLNAIKQKNAGVIHAIVAGTSKVTDEATPINHPAFTELADGTVLFRGSDRVSAAIVRRLREAASYGLPLDAFVNFQDRLAKNPSKRSVDQLAEFLEKCDLPITETGMFVAYKAVRSDFLDQHSGTVRYTPNSAIPVEMPRNLVDDDPNNTCSHGLHVCSKEYGRFAPVLMLVYVDPADVVAVPTDYNASKMRVCRLWCGPVVEDFSEFDGEPVLDTSTYEYEYEDWDAADLLSDYRDDEDDEGATEVGDMVDIEEVSAKQVAVDLYNEMDSLNRSMMDLLDDNLMLDPENANEYVNLRERYDSMEEVLKELQELGSED